MQQIQQDICFLKEGFKNMFNYYKRNGFSGLKLQLLPNYVATLLLIILFYRLIYTIVKCIKNKKIQIFDVLYIVLNRLNRSLILHSEGVENFNWKLVIQVTIYCSLFIALHIMYKEKILCKKKDEEKVTNETKEKPHVN